MSGGLKNSKHQLAKLLDHVAKHSFQFHGYIKYVSTSPFALHGNISAVGVCYMERINITNSQMSPPPPLQLLLQSCSSVPRLMPARYTQ